MKIIAFLIACLLLVVGIYLVKEYQTEQQQREKEKRAEPVLNWLRANGCQIKKLESGIYRLSWQKENRLVVATATWNPRHDSYDDLNRIKNKVKQASEFDQYNATMQKARPVLDWLRNNGCNINKLGVKYEISWRIEYSRPETVTRQPDGSVVINPSSFVSRPEWNLWDPHSDDSYNNLVEIKQKFQNDKAAGRVVVR